MASVSFHPTPLTSYSSLLTGTRPITGTRPRASRLLPDYGAIGQPVLTPLEPPPAAVQEHEIPFLSPAKLQRYRNLVEQHASPLLIAHHFRPMVGPHFCSSIWNDPDSQLFYDTIRNALCRLSLDELDALIIEMQDRERNGNIADTIVVSSRSRTPSDGSGSMDNEVVLTTRRTSFSPSPPHGSTPSIFTYESAAALARERKSQQLDLDQRQKEARAELMRIALVRMSEADRVEEERLEAVKRERQRQVEEEGRLRAHWTRALDGELKQAARFWAGEQFKDGIDEAQRQHAQWMAVTLQKFVEERQEARREAQRRGGGNRGR